MKAILVVLSLLMTQHVQASAVMNCSAGTDRATILYADVINDMNTGAYIRVHEIIPDPSYSWEVLKTPVRKMRMNQAGPIYFAGNGVVFERLSAAVRTREIPGDSVNHVELSDWSLKLESEELEVECRAIFSN